MGTSSDSHDNDAPVGEPDADGNIVHEHENGEIHSHDPVPIDNAPVADPVTVDDEPEFSGPKPHDSDYVDLLLIVKDHQLYANGAPTTQPFKGLDLESFLIVSNAVREEMGRR